MCDLDAELVEYIAKHDSVCPRCRYSLRGLQNALCPECGFVFTLLQLREYQKTIELEQREWFQRSHAIRMQSLIFAAVLLADAAAVMFLVLGTSSGKRLQVALFIVLLAAIELFVFVPLTSKRYRESKLAYFVIVLCEEWFSAIVLVFSLPVIIAVMYLVLWALGFL